MLKPAYLYKDQLEKLKSIIIENEDIYKYYINDSCVTYNLFNIDEGDYSKIQKVSVNSKDEVLGYFRATMSSPNSVSGLALLSFYTTSKKIPFSFVKDTYAFVDYLFSYKKVSHINFCVVVGNPAEKIYDSFIKKFNGRIVGTFKNDTQLIDRSIHDIKWYQLMSDEYFKAKELI